MAAVAVAKPAVAGAVMMSEAEARECVAKIKAGLEDVEARVSELIVCRGWEALGYKTWQECIKHEFQMSRQRAHQLLTAHQVKQILMALPPGPASNAFDAGALTARHRAELAPLADQPERFDAVIERATEARGDKKLRAEDVRKEVGREIGRPERARPSVSSKAEASDFADLSDEAAFAPPPELDLGIVDSTGEAWTRTSSTGQRCGQCEASIPAGQVCHCMDQPDDASLTDRGHQRATEAPGGSALAGDEAPTSSSAPTVALTDRGGEQEADPGVPALTASDDARAPASFPATVTLPGDLDQDGPPSPAEQERRALLERTSGPRPSGTGISAGIGNKSKGGSGSTVARTFSARPLDAGDLSRALLDLPMAQVVEAIAENATASQKAALREALGGTAQPAAPEPKPASIREALGDDACTILELSAAIGETFTVDARASLLALLADEMPAERLAPLAHRLAVRVRPEGTGSAVTLASVKALIREHLSAADVKSLEWDLPNLRKEIGQRERAMAGAR